MPADALAGHLEGFAGYVRQIRGVDSEERAARIIERLRRTRLVVGVEVRPGRDPLGRVSEILGKLCFGLQPIMFFDRALYDSESRLLLGPDGSFDPRATIEPPA
jgi:hypothetical protein